MQTNVKDRTDTYFGNDLYKDYCPLCHNSGTAAYTKGGYSYGARCTCLHGMDLNSFSKSQVNRGYIPEVKPFYSSDENATIKEGRNPFYLPTVWEALGDAEYFEFVAIQKAKYEAAVAEYESRKRERVEEKQ